ncbi:hypothetical protein SH601_11530 [Gracilibacillus sp. S3-1-1]|uniref:Uncharacterized protein n=1 Tax=Gracilibacillus pellucidus TaxID=3095368 RepID=A0ACC6M6U3_9BACI|nr:hypothetical protein [Gracilibacillus sp. S3-1-1]MDX8046613.1 hypothetical protein [Gracilibacillus sp. S3-1-1]
MYQYKLYNNEEIEKMNRDLNRYKKALQDWQNTDTNHYLKAREEVEEINREFVKYKGEMKVMEDTYQKKIENYEQKEQKIATQIHAINHSIQQLKKDVHSIQEEVKELRITELLEKMEQLVEHTDTETQAVKKEIVNQQENYTQMKEQPKTEVAQQPTSRRMSEYRRLQNMLKTATPKNQQMPPATNTTINRQTINNHQANPNMVTMQNGKKTYHNPKYELNKNIIVRKKTGKDLQESQTQIEQTATKSTEPVNNEKKNEPMNPIESVEPVAPKEPITSQPSNQSETKDVTAKAEQSPATPAKQPVTNATPVNQPKSTEITKKVENQPTPEDSQPQNGIKKTWLLAKSLWKK